MSDEFEPIENPVPKQKQKGGIKHFTFNASGTNGASHRANADRRRRQHIKNRETRAELYRSFQGEKGWMRTSPDCKNWHESLDALSHGTA